MGLLSDFLSSPLGEVGYGAAAELYDRANIRATDQRELFRGLGTDLRVERTNNTKLLNQKLSNFRAVEQDFIKNAIKWNTKYEGLSPEELKLKFAPMADFLKGDTFVGKPEDVTKKVFQAIEMSGGFEKDQEYTTFEEFEKKTRSAISSPLEAYSGLGWNTWQNQVGTSLAYKTPEYETAGIVDSAFKITAYNYSMFFPGPMKPSDNAVLDVARLAILNYNARNDSMKDGVLDLYEFDKLRKQRFDKIQRGPDKIDMGVLPSLLGINQATLDKIITEDSPYLASLSGALTQISGIVNKEGGIQSDEFKDLAATISGLMQSHFSYAENIQKALLEKEYTGIEIKDTSAVALYSKLKLEKTFKKIAGGDTNIGKEDAYRISRTHNKIAENPERTRIAIQTDKQGKSIEGSGIFGVYLNKDAGGQIDGRIQESFTFMLVPSGETTLDKELGKQVTKPAKWVAVSNTGIIFDMPSIADLARAQSGAPDLQTPQTISHLPVGTVTDPKDFYELQAAAKNPADLNSVNSSGVKFDRTDEGRTALREHAKAVIHAAMEGKLDLTKRFWDPNYIRLLESQGIFGKDPTNFDNISYFGLEKQK